MKRYAKFTIFFFIFIVLPIVMAPSALAADVFTTDTTVRLRAEASTASEVITTLPPGTSVEVLEHDPAGWSRVKAGDAIGHIRSDLLTFPAGSLPATFRTTEGVNMRSTQSTDGEVVRRIYAGESVEVLDHDPAGWSRVRYDGSEGFVRSDFLMRRISSSGTTSSGSSSRSSSSSGGNETRVMWTTDGVNLRSGPSTDASIIRTVSAGSAVSVTGYNPSGWSSVSVGGSSGYIKSEFLRPSTSSVELLEWSAVKRILQRHVPYQVIDVRTGTTYKIQAFSLGNHADVEPPTQADTDILHNLYGGVWSWNPRPVWVLIDGRLIAAAINGMPHGGGVISGNGMNGQICLHFFGSYVHNGNASYARQMQGGVMEAFEASR